jgi:pyruvate formate lyase activating enzyme
MKAFFAGILDLSTIDYPGKISSVVFLAGCNLCCRYCFNFRFLELKDEFLKNSEDLKKDVAKNLPLIEAIMFSGGEPLLQEEVLVDISTWAKTNGLSVGIETNGTKPKVLEKLLNMKLLDFVAVDVKAPFTKYESVVQANNQVTRKIIESIEIVRQAKVDHELRTTFVPGLITTDDIEDISRIVGQDKWAWQRFRYDLGEILDKQLLGRDFSLEEMKKFEILSKKYRNVILQF